MTKDKLITVPEGTTPEQAREILHKHRIEKLPIVDDQMNLKGMITVKDIMKKLRYPEFLQRRPWTSARRRGLGSRQGHDSSRRSGC